MRAFRDTLITLHVILAAAGGIFFRTQLPKGRISAVAFLFLLLFCCLDLGYYLYFRKRFVAFSEEVCRKADQIIRNGNNRIGEDCRQNARADWDCGQNQETLTSKLTMELEKLENITRNRLSESEREKEKLQKTISEIAHQVKTPLSNIRMYQDMLTEPDLSPDEAKQFTEIMGQQIGNLEFLIDSLVKASRLESDLIRMNIENTSVLHTLTASVNGIVRKADRKKIDLLVHCDPDITAFHDVKWTVEAIGNILDNGVKYTPEGGLICIDVRPGELYAEIRVRDTGKGIAPAHYNDIFKRFYREDSSRNAKGLGLGLYIARNIIMREGGYIMVRSVPGEGSLFSVFLPMHHIP